MCIARGAKGILTVGLIVAAALSVGCQGAPKWTFRKEKSERNDKALVEQEELKISTPEPEDPDPKMLIDFAYVRMSMNQPAGAADMFERAIKADPKSIEGYVGLAKVKVSMGHPDQAISVLKKGLKRHPKSAPLWNEMGIAYTKSENWTEAVKALETAIKHDPQEDLYQSNLAGVLTVSGKVDRAYRIYSELMTAADAHTQIARILGGQGKTDECRKHLELALKAEPKHELAQNLRTQLTDPNLRAVGYHSPDRDDRKSLVMPAGASSRSF